MSKKALIIFAKHPVPGGVKTRLAPAVSPEWAARLYEAMLLDVLELTAQVGAERFLFHAPSAGAGDYFRQRADGCRIFEQAGEDLGERMAAAFSRVLDVGRSAVIVGTDSPDLPVDYVAEAFRVLQSGEAEVVVGPSEDGGYYLLGMNRLYPELFQGIRWSTNSVAAETVAKGEQAGRKVTLLPEWYDVDESADLRRESLLKANSPARRTRDFLARHLGDSGSRGDAGARRNAIEGTGSFSA